MAEEDLTEIVEPCPLLKYCVDGARLSDIEICEGTMGDYKTCTVYQHYLEEDIEHHNPPVRIRDENKN